MVNFSYCERIPVKTTPVDPVFGKAFAPHCLHMKMTLGQTSNFEARIVPFQREPYSPATIAFHYGQTVFEGMKAFHQADGKVGIFRPDLHAERFFNSAKMLSMAPLPTDVFLQCLREYVKFESEFVPTAKDHALYLRPFLIGTDEVIKLNASQSYDFYIISCAVGNYFKNGLKPARVLVNPSYIRAYPGGLGEAKTGANYAASLGPQKVAESHQCDQVLYLDAIHHENVDEMGGMNVFFVKNKKLITPSLNGAILNGVTRRSILELAPSLGYEASEETVSFQDVVDQIKSGEIREAFACGTAAVVQPIGEFVFVDPKTEDAKKIPLPESYDNATTIREKLTKIQRGQTQDPDGWVCKPETTPPPIAGKKKFESSFISHTN